ncbi:MAG: hypothetical protein A2106_03350 [Planctomycetes bacterium GWF2_40_8]|nr:MAG: hypothetical protein A2106_03350 [Planctomycetes bacterium GWF2_40_8]OHB87520.1 MAG: hypothetical protein A3D13_03325 [Planctomycetes bacterium RIFCSPHIGHO2_02_FULL_40_12]
MSQQTQALFDIILANIDHGVIVYDANNLVQHVNPAFERMTGYTASEVLGKDLEMLVSGQADRAIISTMRGSIDTKDCWQGEIKIRHRKGGTCPFNSSIHILPGQTGQPHNYVTIIRNVVENRDLDKDDRHNIQCNLLTGLPNQHLFKDRLEQVLITSKRVNKSAAILVCGLDRFSIINDGLGHAFGDLLLKAVALRLKSCFRGSDTVAHIEGDCFGMVLQMTATDDGVTIAEKILKAIKRPFEIKGQEVTVTASIGISLYPTDDENVDKLIAYAKSAMRHAKKGSGNKYQFFSNNMNTKAKKRIEMECSLRRAIEHKEFILYYQPKVNAESQQIVGAEALMRWQDPENGMISPAVFIPVAEETGLIEPIGTWGLREACRQNKQWQDKGLRPIRVSVNVSGRQLLATDFADKIKVILEESGLLSRYLELEITESLLMDNTGDNINKLQQIRDLGCHISIDDFGTGYSSLSYLTRFPISALKIDRAFIKEVESSKNASEVARAIIGLSQGLQMEVIAEGAENIKHVNFLRQNGCDTVQGYYYSRPVPAEEFEDLLSIVFIKW